MGLMTSWSRVYGRLALRWVGSLEMRREPADEDLLPTGARGYPTRLTKPTRPTRPHRPTTPSVSARSLPGPNAQLSETRFLSPFREPRDRSGAAVRGTRSPR